jgi:hypothetical protein
MTKHFPKGLDGRQRDADGEIRKKRSDTLVGTLRGPTLDRRDVFPRLVIARTVAMMHGIEDPKLLLARGVEDFQHMGTQWLASATALMRGQSVPPSEMKSLYGSTTSSGMMPLSYVGVFTVFPPALAELWLADR